MDGDFYIKTFFFIVAILFIALPIASHVISEIMEDYRKNKQKTCYHLWRRSDVNYSQSRARYYYHCEKCKLEKSLWEKDADRFEREFMRDW